MELLTCPFCGSNDYKHNNMLWGATKWYFITCKNCKCRMQHFDKNLLREKWNKRIITNDKLPISTELVDQWISVKDRLPLQTLSVLIYNGYFIDIGAYVVDNYFMTVQGSVLDVTYWQPLPKPPKGIE